MLYYALVFLVIAVVAAALGFGGIAGTSAEFAKNPFRGILGSVRGLAGRRTSDPLNEGHSPNCVESRLAGNQLKAAIHRA